MFSFAILWGKCISPNQGNNGEPLSEARTTGGEEQTLNLVAREYDSHPGSIWETPYMIYTSFELF